MLTFIEKLRLITSFYDLKKSWPLFPIKVFVRQHRNGDDIIKNLSVTRQVLYDTTILQSEILKESDQSHFALHFPF